MNRSLVPALVGAVLFAACSSSKDEPDAGELCDTVVEGLAARIATCHGRTEALALDRLRGTWSCGEVAAAERAGRTRLDRAKASECLAAVDALTCHTLDLLDGVPPTACQEALVGQVAVGGECTLAYDTSECDRGYCQLSACNAPGTCAPLAFEGESCAALPCGPELGCRLTDHVCIREPGPLELAEDEPCDGDLDCRDGLYCDSAATCQPRLAQNADCTRDSACVPGLRCDGFTGACVPLTYVGGRCVPGDGDCLSGDSCDDATERCVAWPGVGGACGYPDGASEYRGCSDSYCDEDSGTCAAFLPLDAACQAGPGANPCGPFATCTDGFCAASYCGDRR